ncbi:MAG: dockerin type I repeat-containing protein, partial [Clostridia bacterium]|nr:dockerin type I repeat-containing protein [Clostridia bacterium]
VNATVPAGMQIFGLWIMGDTVYYRVSDTPNGQMQVLSCSVDGLADYLWGDADQNGTVDGRDVTAMLRYLQGLPAVCHTGAADLDDSGAVDARDVEILRQYLVENH